jgi:low affinity Fe/Cu permease
MGEVFEDGSYLAAVTPNWSDLARVRSGRAGSICVCMVEWRIAVFVCLLLLLFVWSIIIGWSSTWKG